jgi:hypothetical protein
MNNDRDDGIIVRQARWATFTMKIQIEVQLFGPKWLTHSMCVSLFFTTDEGGLSLA